MLAGVLVGLDVWTKPSVRVSRNATRSFSSALVKPRWPMVIFSLFGSSGGGQQFTFSTVPGRHCPRFSTLASLLRSAFSGGHCVAKQPGLLLYDARKRPARHLATKQSPAI